MKTTFLLFLTLPLFACEQPDITVEVHEQTVEITGSYEPEQYPAVVRSTNPELAESSTEESKLTAKQKYALIAAAITTGGSLITAVVTYLLTHYLGKESE